jgi:hypothetical protein
MNNKAVTWDELRAELVQPGDKPEVTQLRDELLTRQRACQLAEVALPIFDSGRPLTPEDMDDALYEHIKERAARR